MNCEVGFHPRFSNDDKTIKVPTPYFLKLIINKRRFQPLSSKSIIQQHQFPAPVLFFIDHSTQYNVDPASPFLTPHSTAFV
jgi:hypothetical protein